MLGGGGAGHAALGAAVDSTFADLKVVGASDLVWAASSHAPPTPEFHAPGVCPACLIQMDAVGTEFHCSRCHSILDTGRCLEEEDFTPAARPARLHMLGPDHRTYQRDLNRDAPSDRTGVQRESVQAEYQAFNRAHTAAGFKPFPAAILQTATGYYNQVQRSYVKRSNCKRTIMSVCLYHACVYHFAVRERHECATFCRLEARRGAARGDAFLRGMCADGLATVRVNADLVRPYVETVFGLLELEGHPELRDATREIVDTMVGKFVATASETRSKVFGAAYEVLTRARCWDRAPVGLKELCARGGIRTNTVAKVRTCMASFHSIFIPIYKKYGLTDA